jgi:hypothetical protein
MRKIPKAKKHVGVNLDVNVWRNIKIEATRSDMTLTDWVEQSLVSSQLKPSGNNYGRYNRLHRP